MVLDTDETAELLREHAERTGQSLGWLVSYALHVAAPELDRLPARPRMPTRRKNPGDGERF